MSNYKIRCYIMDTYADLDADGSHVLSCWAGDAVYATIQEKYNISDEKMKMFKWKEDEPDELLEYRDVCAAMYDTFANYYAAYFIEYITRFAALSCNIESESADNIGEIRKKFCIETYNSNWINLGLSDGEVDVDDWKIETYMDMFEEPLEPAKVTKLIDNAKINLDYPFDSVKLANFISDFNTEYFEEQELDSGYETGYGLLKYIFDRSITPTIFSKWFNTDEQSDYFGLTGSTWLYKNKTLAEEIIHNGIFADFTYALFYNNAKHLRNFIQDEWWEALETSNSWLMKENEDICFSDIVEIVANTPEMQAFLKENANNAESKELTKEDVLEAIKAYDEGKRPENCGTSKTVFLAHNGKTYPIKAIYALATGVEGGSFHIKAEKTLKDLGFTIARTE